jgi:hypothetical protein
MTKLELSTIRIDGGTQARASLNQSIVREYAESMKDGEKFPEIIVFFDGSDHWLADGFHRYFAYKSNEVEEVEVDLREGTKDDAILFGFQANKHRGLRMSHEDIRGIIIRMIHHPEWGKWTNASIAAHLGVSAMTVGRVKKTLEPEETKVKKYINSQGKEALIDTTKLSTRKKKEEPSDPPKQEPEADPEDDIIHELTETIQSLSEENTLLKDKIAVGQWDASEIEKIDVEETLADLRQKVAILEKENETLRTSRDMYMNRNAELMQTVKTLQNKLKKLEAK